MLLQKLFRPIMKSLKRPLSKPVVPGGPQILADYLTLSQPEGAYYAQYITTGTSGF